MVPTANELRDVTVGIVIAIVAVCIFRQLGIEAFQGAERIFNLLVGF